MDYEASIFAQLPDRESAARDERDREDEERLYRYGFSIEHVEYTLIGLTWGLVFMATAFAIAGLAAAWVMG